MKFLPQIIFIAFSINLCITTTLYAETDYYNDGQQVEDNVSDKTSSEILQDFFSIFGGGSTDVSIDGGSLNPKNSPTDTDSSIDDPQIYGPLPLNSQVASTAQKIASSVKSSCTQYPDDRGGIVRSGNASCVDPVASVIGGTTGSQVVADLKTSATLYSNLQCVGCVVAFAKTTKPYSVWGNAKDYINKKIDGYKYVPGNKTATDKSYFSQIKPGSFFIINKWVYGHIGIVTDIITDSNGVPHSFRAFECNYGAPGLLRHDLTWSFLEVDGFQVPL